jgi:hypothetical protein
MAQSRKKRKKQKPLVTGKIKKRKIYDHSIAALVEKKSNKLSASGELKKMHSTTLISSFASLVISLITTANLLELAMRALHLRKCLKMEICTLQ